MLGLPGRGYKMPFTQQVIPTGLSSQTLPNWISALERLQGGRVSDPSQDRLYAVNLFSASSVEGFVPHTTPPLAGFAVGPAALATGRRLQSAPGRRGSKE